MLRSLALLRTGSGPARVRISLTDGNGTQRTVEIVLNAMSPVASDGR